MWPKKKRQEDGGFAACSHAEPTCCRPEGLTLLEPPKGEPSPAERKLLFCQESGRLPFQQTEGYHEM